MQVIGTPENEAALIERAVKIRAEAMIANARQTASILPSQRNLIAFAEELGRTRISEILSFDKGLKNQIANAAPNVSLNLLTI